jgi:hypothetical protein
MPQTIPFNNVGSRIITVELGENVFRMRTYYLPHIKKWILDIMDSDGNPIIMGISLNLGVGNLVKNKSILFENQVIRCEGTIDTEWDSLGKTFQVLYYPVGESAPNLYKDKML